MDGHAAGLGGCIVDSGNFDWTKYPEKYPGLCTPDDSYHGVIYTERFGIGGAYITKATAQLMRDFGAMQSPQNAFILNLGLKIAAIETHVADARTCCLHPASATHRQMNDEELEACGVKPDLIRYSCGLENAEDLIADLSQALEQI